MNERIPAEAWHPSIYILEELDARGWSIADLAKRMPGDFAVNNLAMETYLLIGPGEPKLRIGDTAGLAQAFDVDAALFTNLENAWLNHPTTQAMLNCADGTEQ